MLAIHKCAHVDVYGFSQGSGHYFKKFTGKPKGWGNPNKAIRMNKRPHSKRHSWSAEKACIRRLTNEIPEVKLKSRAQQRQGGDRPSFHPLEIDVGGRRRLLLRFFLR